MSTELFEELVANGEKIEADVRGAVTKNERVTKVVDAVSKFGGQRKAKFEERVGSLRKGFGRKVGASNTDEKLASLSEEVSALRADIAAIKKAVTKKTAKKAVAKKAVAKKPTAKKPVAKTPTAKISTEKKAV